MKPKNLSRIEKLEQSTGAGEALAVFRVGEDEFVHFIEPKEREHDQLTPDEFREFYPNGTLITVKRVQREQMNRKSAI